MYDIIGDIHGYADQLEALLKKMGYVKIRGSYRHPERQVLFVGDYIDRGPKIPETLRMVREMVESKQAIALMGNHEYNAMCFNKENPTGGYLRPHSIKNIMQHWETLFQFEKIPKEYLDFISWFETLPLWFENDDFRVVHACWDSLTLDQLRQILPNNLLEKDNLELSSNPNTAIFQLVETTLKGKEVGLPNGLSYSDKEGNKRNNIRIKWWENPENKFLDELSIPSGLNIGHTVYAENKPTTFYGEDQKPVFFGHYWMQGTPKLQKKNVCCLDFSVADGGVLTAYQYQGEKDLSQSNFVYI